MPTEKITTGVCTWLRLVRRTATSSPMVLAATSANTSQKIGWLRVRLKNSKISTPDELAGTSSSRNWRSRRASGERFAAGGRSLLSIVTRPILVTPHPPVLRSAP